MSFVKDIFGGKKAPTIAPYSASPITTPLGTVTPTGSGGVTTALSPELQKFFNLYTSAAESALPSEEQLSFATDVSELGKGLFGRGAGIDIGAKTRDYYSQTLRALEPERAMEEARLADTLFKTGRTGAAVGTTGGYINPEQYSLLKARESANAQLFLGAEDRARQQQLDDLRNALGFYGTGQELTTAPLTTAAGLLGTGINIAGLPNQFIPYSLQAGQNVTGVNQANAQIEAQNQANRLGFWGGLIGSTVNAFNPFSKLSGLFSNVGFGQDAGNLNASNAYSSGLSTGGGWAPTPGYIRLF